MIIKLTSAEVKNLVSIALNMQGLSFDLEIESPDAQILSAFRIAIREFPRGATDQKISCIKRFRELCPRHSDRDGFSCCDVSLTDAKWAVENSTVALANLERTGNIRG